MKLFTTISSLLAILVTVKADGLGGLVYAPGHASLNYYSYPSYAFEYAVRDPHTGDNKAQWEKRDGDTVRGAYSLVEPDGTIRVVEYRADDKSGFNAIVKRIGPNLHPVAAPIYKAPLPVLGQKLITPMSIGPVAGLKGLSDAPLLNGPIIGGGLSSGNLFKASVPIIKDIGPISPVSPILPAPILKEPLLGLSHGPIIKQPLLGPLPHAPIWKEPIVPIVPGPIIKEPIYGHGLKGPLLGPLPQLYGPGPIIKGPLLKEPLLGPLPYGPISIKEPWLGPLPHGPLPIKEPWLGQLPYGPISIKEPWLGPLPLGPISLKEPIGGLDLLGKGLLGKGGYGWGH